MRTAREVLKKHLHKVKEDKLVSDAYPDEDEFFLSHPVVHMTLPAMEEYAAQFKSPTTSVGDWRTGSEFKKERKRKEKVHWRQKIDKLPVYPPSINDDFLDDYEWLYELV